MSILFIASILNLSLLGNIGFQIFGILFGAIVGVGGYLLVQHRMSVRWRRLAEIYETSEEPAGVVSVIRNEHLCLYDQFPQRYLGAIDMAVTEKGLDVRVNSFFKVFYPFHPPLLIPLAEIQLSPTSYWLNSYTCKIETERVPGVEVLITDDAKRWYEMAVGRGPDYQAELLLGGLDSSEF